MTSFAEKIKKLEIESDTFVTLTYEEGADVFHYNETEVETALENTDVVETLCALLATPRLDARNSWSGENIMQSLRDQDLLEDYERGSYDFENYLADTIKENFYDLELVDYSTEKYDHKRGFTTLTATVKVPVENFIETDPACYGWTVSVQTTSGTLTLS
jgi:hypothetical protein